MFFPGETDTQTFLLPFPADIIEKGIFTYKQQQKTIFEKELSQFIPTEDGNCKAVVYITQRDSLKFNDKYDVNIQVNLLFKDGERGACDKITYKLGEQYHRTVIT